MSDVPRRLASEARIDRAIDRAVRDMMQLAPRPGFRRRVLERLDPEPIRSSMFFRVAVAAGAIALLILAAVLVVPNRHSQLPISSTTPPQVQARQATPAPAHQPVLETASAPSKQRAPLDQHPTPRLSRRPTALPRVVNVFGNRNSAVAAASVVADTVWPTPPPETHEDRNQGLPPLEIPPVQPPAPIVIPPIHPAGPGLDY